MPFPEAHPGLLRALAERGYAEPTPVQANVLDPETSARDLLVSAQTGSGKTVAFGLAMATSLLGEAERFETAKEPLALVVAPTRELALQVQRELTWLYAKVGARIVACVGGMDIRSEQRALQQGAHVVVGTPGRLCDHLDRGLLVLGKLKVVVLDEADEMLDLGFREDLERMLDTSPPERRTLLFSATIPREIATFAKRYQKDALRIASSSEQEPHGDIEYRVVEIAPQDRDHAVVNLLRYLEARGALVFCATREGVRHLHANLLERGFDVVAVSGELSQPERTRALSALRDGKARVLVATDVAARGLDLPDLGLVIHADLPNDRQTLLHRSGRTGRAGRKGTSVLVVPYGARRRAEAMLGAAKIQAIWSPPPGADQIRARDQERLVKEIAAVAEEPAEEDLVAARALLAEKSPEAIATALLRIYRSRLPEPEELADAAPPPSQVRAPLRDTVWFRMSVGHNGNADPKWIVPFLCRRGHLGKEDIGRISILDQATEFEISRRAADRFAAAIARPDTTQDREIEIRPVRGESGRGESGRGESGRSEAPPRGGPRGDAPAPRGGARGEAPAPRGGAPRGSHPPSQRPPFRARPEKKGYPKTKPYVKPEGKPATEKARGGEKPPKKRRP